MYVLKPELDGCVVTVLTRWQAESEPHTIRVADILYLDVGSLSASGLATHRTLHLPMRDFLIASETVGRERSTRASFA